MWTVYVPLLPPPKFQRFARRLRGAREFDRRSKHDMTAMLGVTMTQYELWERGYELPDRDTIRKLERFFLTRLED